MTFTRNHRIAATALALGLVAAACGSDDPSEEAADETPASAAEAGSDEEMDDEEMDDEMMDDEEMDDEMMEGAVEITVTITNVSEDAAVPTPIAPGAYAVHLPEAGLFTVGEPDAGLGLEALAEDGDPSTLTESLDGVEAVLHLGAFAVPDDADEPGPVLPGSSYSFTTPIAPGEPLSLTTMFVQSNDWIFATPAEGIDVFDAEGNLVEGDVSDEILVIDAGTEIDQTPGEGPDQAPRQAGPNTGDADPDPAVRLVDGFSAGDYVQVTIALAS